MRIGSCGVELTPELGLNDIVLAQAASTDSNYLAQFDLPTRGPPPVPSGCWTTCTAAPPSVGSPPRHRRVIGRLYHAQDDHAALGPDGRARRGDGDRGGSTPTPRPPVEPWPCSRLRRP
ncbi:hypothetical protein QJS66_20805 [Kocuria rhizophila]|nr:hypothetical protein QJS66_20805 [Kocuria rhizophila]